MIIDFLFLQFLGGWVGGFELIRSSNSPQFLFFEKNNYFAFCKEIHFYILIEYRMISHLRDS